VNGDPELLAGLVLHDGNEALIDVAPPDREHVRELLAGVEGERGGFPEMG
jgi:hypothetical protein